MKGCTFSLTPTRFFLSMYSPRTHPGPPSPMDSEILIKPLSLWPEYSTGGRLDSVGTWHIECGRTDKRAQKIVAVTFCRWLLRFSLPAHTERGEQYDTLHGQEDGHFLTTWGSYNSLVVTRRGFEPRAHCLKGMAQKARKYTDSNGLPHFFCSVCPEICPESSRSPLVRRFPMQALAARRRRRILRRSAPRDGSA
jgi:hypothetical protein